MPALVGLETHPDVRDLLDGAKGWSGASGAIVKLVSSLLYRVDVAGQFPKLADARHCCVQSY